MTETPGSVHAGHVRERCQHKGKSGTAIERHISGIHRSDIRHRYEYGVTAFEPLHLGSEAEHSALVADCVTVIAAIESEQAVAHLAARLGGPPCLHKGQLL